MNCESEKDRNDIPGPCSEILKETKGKSQQSKLHAFFKKKERNFIRKVKSLHYATVKEDQSRGITVALTKIFILGFEIKVMYKI